MSEKTDDLFEEILKNVRDDREKVKTVRDSIVSLVGGDVSEKEPLTMLAISENVAKLSDVLTKMNSQLVELTKVSVKKDILKPPDERDDIFDEIESSGAFSDKGID